MHTTARPCAHPCTCPRTHLHIYAHIRAHTCMLMHMPVHTPAYLRTHLRTQLHARAHTRARALAHTCASMHTSMHMLMHTPACPCTRPCTHLPSGHPHRRVMVSKVGTQVQAHGGSPLKREDLHPRGPHFATIHPNKVPRHPLAPAYQSRCPLLHSTPFPGSSCILAASSSLGPPVGWTLLHPEWGHKQGSSSWVVVSRYLCKLEGLVLPPGLRINMVLVWHHVVTLFQGTAET